MRYTAIFSVAVLGLVRGGGGNCRCVAYSPYVDLSPEGVRIPFVVLNFFFSRYSFDGGNFPHGDELGSETGTVVLAPTLTTRLPVVSPIDGEILPC